MFYKINFHRQSFEIEQVSIILSDKKELINIIFVLEEAKSVLSWELEHFDLSDIGLSINSMKKYNVKIPYKK